jgi:undecaprenyl pyrophosphate synthase
MTELKLDVPPERIPRHIAIIMDGKADGQKNADCLG